MKPDRPTTPEPILTTARWSSALERLEERMLMAADVDVALIDRALPDHAILVRAMQPGGKVFLYDGQNDSAEQILSRLTTWAEKTGNRLRSISLMSHGAAGRFALGNDWITKSNLDQTEDQWQRLGKVLARGATVNLFGCNLIDGRGDGKVLINRLSKAVGATVFASTDLTGRGGDWVLEAASRGSRARLASHPFSIMKLSRWGGNLASSLGSEFLVNTTTTSIQRTHEGAQAIATDANGNFVIVWSGQGPGDTAGIFAQRYNALGVPQGPEFRVNTTTTGTQTSPAVAMDADGDFIVVWSGEGSDDTAGIFAQRFNASGAAQGAEFRVNTSLANVQTHPSVAMSDAGSFVISWTSANQDGAAGGIYARRYDPAGVAQSGEFLVNFVNTANDQDHSRVAMDADGDFVIVWASVINSFFGWGIAGQRFDASGAALTTGGSSEFIINTSFDGDQQYPSIAISPGGAFVVAWQSQNGTQDGSGPGVYARQYDAAGNSLTAAEFRVNVTTDNAQQYPSTAMDDAGNFSITWQSNLQDGDGWGIYARDYNAAGAAQSGEYLVNATTSSSQQYSSMAMDANGDFVVAWSGNGAGDTDGVFARRYRSIWAGITVSPTSGLTTTEAGGTASFTVVLDHQPTSNVTVTLTSSDTTEGAISGPLTFTPDHWNVAQTVTITGANDFLDDGNVNYTITTTASSSDAAYDSLAASDVSVTNSDDDTAGITVNPTSGLVTTEAGGTATFTVVLTSEPTANVTVSLLSMNTGEGTVPISSLVFTSANWNIAQTVTVTGTDDSRDDGDIVYTIQTSAADSSDPLYNGMAVADVFVTNSDDDIAGIIVSPKSGLTTTEAGGTATFIVVLTSQPASDVVINLSSSNTAEGTLSDSSITFTSVNWDQPQTVTVTGVDDDFDDGDANSNPTYSIITAAAISDDGQYSGMNSDDVALSNIDDDISGFEFYFPQGTPLTTTESSGIAEFWIRLRSQPTDAAVITIDTSDNTEGSATPNSYPLNSSNWDDWQVIRVTGIDDALLDGDIDYQLFISASSSDLTYNGLQETLNVTNYDNDTPGFIVTPPTTPATPLIVSESGAEATFNVVLRSAPTQNVIINLVLGDGTEATLSITSLTFTPGNWNTPQPVTVTGLDDALDDGDIDFMITLVPSGDSVYAALDPMDVHVRNEDNERVRVSLTTPPFTTEASGTARLRIVLDSRPTDVVTVQLFSSDEGEGVLAETLLFFTPDDWNIAQFVDVTGVDDGIVDGDVAYTISFTTSSTDPDFDNLPVADVALTNRDTTVSPPAITTGAGTLYFTENDAPERIDDALVVADANGVLTSATIRIITNYARGEDRLAFTNRDGISGVWNAPTGTLLLTGTATVAQYQEALRSVTYENTSEDPSAAVRTVRFTISDDDSIASATKSVAVEPVNDAPAGVAESYSVSADSRLVTNETHGVLRNDNDAEGDDLSAVLVSPPTFGELTLNPDGSFTYLAGAAGTYTFVYQTTDGQDAGEPVTVTITVNPAEEAPLIPGKPGDPPPRPEKPPIGKPEVPARPEKPDKPEKPKSPPREKPRQSDPPVAPPMHVTPPPARTMSPPARVQIGVVARAEAAVMLTRAIYVEAETIDFAQHPVVVETRPNNPDVTTINIAALPKWEITETLSNSLDQLADQLAAETQGPNTAAAVVGSAALVWVGYVVYSLRGGALLLTFLTSMPLWRTLDPLPVLEASEARAARRKNRKKRRSGDQDDPEERSLRSVLG